MALDDTTIIIIQEEEIITKVKDDNTEVIVGFGFQIPGPIGYTYPALALDGSVCVPLGLRWLVFGSG